MIVMKTAQTAVLISKDSEYPASQYRFALPYPRGNLWGPALDLLLTSPGDFVVESEMDGVGKTRFRDVKIKAFIEIIAFLQPVAVN